MVNVSALNDSSYGVTALQAQSGFVAPVSESQSGTAVPALQEPENGYEHTKSDHENDLFSSNRRTALQAYLSYGKSGTDSTAATTDTSAQSTSDPAGENTAESDETSKDDEVSDPTAKRGVDGEELSESESQEVQELEDRDAEVKAHERAHQAAGGQYAGAPQYEYERGPDGKDYATEGHVDIDVSEESTPDKTLQKMERVMAAARAPAEPSSQDLKVAAEANRTAAEARAEIAAGNGDGEDSEDTGVADESGDAAKSSGTASDSGKAGDATKAADDSSTSADDEQNDDAKVAADNSESVTPSSLTDMARSLESVLAS